MDITTKALAQLAKEGYDPVYGARPLRRLIQTAIENPIAILLINKTIVQGDTILVDYDEVKTEYLFTKKVLNGQAQPQPQQPPVPSV